MFMCLSLKTIFFIFLSITLAFDRCRHTENIDLQYVCLSVRPSVDRYVCMYVCMSTPDDRIPKQLLFGELGHGMRRHAGSSISLLQRISKEQS